MNQPLSFYNPTDPDTGYLSNFFRAPFDLDGHTWPTVEHYYQAQKFEDEAYRTKVRDAANPREAKTLGQSREVPMREDWATHRMTAMLAALAAKFAQHEALRSRLLATGDAVLVEASPTDAFWGDGADGQGENRLGYLLTTLRDQLRLIQAGESAATISSGELAHACFASVRQLHVTWFLPDALRQEAQIGVIGNQLYPYVRDVALPSGYVARYRPGLIFREPTLCDASEHVGGFAARDRYLLLSANARHLDALFGGMSGSPGTGLCVFQPDSLWKVLAVHRNEDHAQITLLEIPPVGIHAFNCQAPTEFEQELAGRAGANFESTTKHEPVAACATPEWLERLQHPLGINDEGEFLECWFNGIHRGGDATEPLPPVKTGTPPDSAANTLFQPITPRTRLLTRLIGFAVLLIGLGIALDMITGPRPPQLVIMSLVMIGMGGFVAWKPDTLS